MKRYLTILALVLAATATLTALSTSPAAAGEEQTVEADFTASIESGEKAKIDGEQIGSNSVTIGSLPSLTCSTIKYNGEAATEGPSSKQIILSPEYETCHVIVPLLGTKTTTVTTNSCTFKIETKATITENEEEHLIGTTNIECPTGKKIEIFVYNTSNSKDEGASTLCKYDVEAQSNLSGVTFANDVNTPTTVNDVVVNFGIESATAIRTTGAEALCGAEKQTMKYKGEATLRATNKSSAYVDAMIQDGKRMGFGSATPFAIAENGEAELTTESLKVKCTSVKYEASPGAQNVTTLKIKPTYSGCITEPGKLTTDVEFQGCEYLQTLETDVVLTDKIGIHTPGPLAISCGVGKNIQITATEGGKAKCTILLREQAPVGPIVDLKNMRPTKKVSENYVLFTNTVVALSYEVIGEEKACGKNEEMHDGQLHGKTEMKAYTDAKKTTQVSFEIRGLL